MQSRGGKVLLSSADRAAARSALNTRALGLFNGREEKTVIHHLVPESAPGRRCRILPDR